MGREEENREGKSTSNETQDTQDSGAGVNTPQGVPPNHRPTKKLTTDRERHKYMASRVGPVCRIHPWVGTKRLIL